MTNDLPRLVVFGEALTDTVGCGDACMGGWIASLLTRPDAPAADHLRFAAACASLTCARHGAYAPTPDKVDAKLRA